MFPKTLACVLVLSGVAIPARAQNQQPGSQPGWPCEGTVDPTYVRTAEASGGKVLLFQPAETTGLTEDASASRTHPETVVRLAGSLEPGPREFQVPLDSTIESVYFFVSLQCLQDVTIVRPSGEAVRADTEGVDGHSFAAIRLVTIKAPSPGTWKVAVAGRGFFNLIVAAKTRLALRSVSFVENGTPIKGLAPLGKPVRLQAAVSGEPRSLAFRFVSMGAALLGEAALVPEDEVSGTRTYAAEVTLPATEFRMLMTGLDANGFPFQRITSQLFVGGR